MGAPRQYQSSAPIISSSPNAFAASSVDYCVATMVVNQYDDPNRNILSLFEDGSRVAAQSRQLKLMAGVGTFTFVHRAFSAANRSDDVWEQLSSKSYAMLMASLDWQPRCRATLKLDVDGFFCLNRIQLAPALAWAYVGSVVRSVRMHYPHGHKCAAPVHGSRPPTTPRCSEPHVLLQVPFHSVQGARETL